MNSVRITIVKTLINMFFLCLLNDLWTSVPARMKHRSTNESSGDRDTAVDERDGINRQETGEPEGRISMGKTTNVIKNHHYCYKKLKNPNGHQVNNMRTLVCDSPDSRHNNPNICNIFSQKQLYMDELLKLHG